MVRHGETETNIQGRIHVSKSTEELTTKGTCQMSRVADELIKYKPARIYSSKEKRAIQSAKIISEKLNITLTEKEVAGMDKMSFEKRYTFYPPNGESWKEVEERLLKVLNEVLSSNTGKSVVLVTHGGTIRILMPTLLGVTKEESYKYDPDNASISIFDYDDNKFSKVAYNDTSFL